MKHWFMTQIWRFTQIASMATLALMMLNLSLALYKYVEWRFANTYIGLLIIMFILTTIIWLVAWYYDKHLKLWREQMMVSVDRNPYAQDRLTPKELLFMESIWIPIVNHADPNSANKLKQWVNMERKKYPDVQAQVDEIRKMIE